MEQYGHGSKISEPVDLVMGWEQTEQGYLGGGRPGVDVSREKEEGWDEGMG